MNNNNIFLQLRQETSENVYRNGEFDSKLSRPITIEEGDKITLAKTIIDSRLSTSGKIILEKETTIGFTFYYYLQHSDSADKYTDASRNTDFDLADLDDYIMCKKEGGKYTPIVATASVNFKRGVYSPSAFAQRLNRLITQNKQNATFQSEKKSSSNPILQSTFSLQKDYKDPVFINMRNPSKCFFYGKKNTATTGFFHVGTNQFELSYDEEQNNFRFDYTHFPLYDNSGNITVEYVGVDSSGNFKLASRYGGIAFRSFFSTQDKKEINLWRDILGFDLDSLTRPIPSITSQATIDNISYEVPNFESNFQVGREVTTGSTQIDVGVVKVSSKNLPVLPLTTQISASQTEPIFSDEDFSFTGNNATAYFLVEINAGMTQDLITNNDIHTNIFGIISKYYQNANYSYSSLEDSIVYTHVGAPITINSFRIRILDSTYNVPTDLGSDNSVFLQLNKASLPAISYQQENEKNKDNKK